MKRPFFWLMAVLIMLLALGVWLLVLGVRTPPVAVHGITSM